MGSRDGCRIVDCAGFTSRVEPAQFLNVCAFRQMERVLDVDTKIADRALDLGVAEQDLDRPQIAGCFVDDRRLRSPQRVRAVMRLMRW
jgi:hypothetical protein